MKIREYKQKRPNRPVSDLDLYAGEFLEHHGQLFLVNFGVSNAVDKATDLFLERLDEILWDEAHGIK
jgi:hypothetical protein